MKISSRKCIKVWYISVWKSMVKLNSGYEDILIFEN